MNRSLLLCLLTLLIIPSCGNNEPQTVREQGNIDERLQGISVVLYKSLKLGARGAADIGLGDATQSIMAADSLSVRKSLVENKNALELNAIFELATSRRNWVLATNEDDYPTIYRRAHGDDLLHFQRDNIQIEWTASHEHLVLAAINILAKQYVNLFSLYEAELIDESQFKQDDWAIITHLLKGTQYYLYYAPHLAELECTRGIDHVDQANLNLEFLGRNNEEIMHDSYKAMFLLLRSFSRVAMEDEGRLAGANEDLLQASLLLESNTDQELLSSLLAAQDAYERGESTEALLELRRAKEVYFTDLYLEDEIDDVIQFIEGDETRRAQRGLERLVSSEGVIIEALGTLLYSSGIMREVSLSKIGNQYESLWQNIDAVGSTFEGIGTTEELLDRGWDLFREEN